MTTTPDFKAALEAFERHSPSILHNMHGETIRTALLIADKVMGEPSEAMIKAGWDIGRSRAMVPPEGYFKAMRDQLLEEINQ